MAKLVVGLACLVCPVLACSSSSSPLGGPGGRDASTPSDTGVDARVNDSGSADSGAQTGPDAADASPTEAGPGDGASADTAPAPGDGGSSDAGPWTGTSPPMGFTRCGNGVFTQSDFAAACAMPPSLLDPMMTMRACNAATISGGEWEVWCGQAADPPYVRVAFDGLAATGQNAGCGAMSTVGFGWIEANGGGSGMNTVASSPMFSMTAPIDVTLYSLGNTTAAATGTGTVLLVVDCTPPPSQTQAIVGGVAISWN